MSKNTRNHYFIGGAKRLAACLLCLAMIATGAPLTDVYAFDGGNDPNGYSVEEDTLQNVPEAAEAEDIDDEFAIQTESDEEAVNEEDSSDPEEAVTEENASVPEEAEAEEDAIEAEDDGDELFGNDQNLCKLSLSSEEDVETERMHLSVSFTGQDNDSVGYSGLLIHPGINGETAYDDENQNRFSRNNGAGDNISENAKYATVTVIGTTDVDRIVSDAYKIDFDSVDGDGNKKTYIKINGEPIELTGKIKRALTSNEGYKIALPDGENWTLDVSVHVRKNEKFDVFLTNNPADPDYRHAQIYLLEDGYADEYEELLSSYHEWEKARDAYSENHGGNVDGFEPSSFEWPVIDTEQYRIDTTTATLTKGETYYIEVIPDYGYQIGGTYGATGTTIEGTLLTPTAYTVSLGTWSFTSQDDHFLASIVKKVGGTNGYDEYGNIVKINHEIIHDEETGDPTDEIVKIEDAAVTTEDGGSDLSALATRGGTLHTIIEDNCEDKLELANEFATFGFSINGERFKGLTVNENEATDITTPWGFYFPERPNGQYAESVKVALTLNNDADADDYSLVRQISTKSGYKGIQWPSSYDKDDKTLTFVTNESGTFSIVPKNTNNDTFKVSFNTQPNKDKIGCVPYGGDFIPQNQWNGYVPVRSGGSFSFRFNVNDGYKITKVTAIPEGGAESEALIPYGSESTYTNGGKKYTRTGIYTIDNVSADTEIRVYSTNTFWVSFNTRPVNTISAEAVHNIGCVPTGGDYIPQDPWNGGVPVANNGSFSFRFNVNEGYGITKVTVVPKGGKESAPLKADGNDKVIKSGKTSYVRTGVYTIDNITANTEIRVYSSETVWVSFNTQENVHEIGCQPTGGDYFPQDPWAGGVPVAKGGSFSFRFNPNAGYVVTEVMAIISETNRFELYPDGAGEYTLGNIEEPTEVRVDSAIPAFDLSSKITHYQEEERGITVEPAGDDPTDDGLIDAGDGLYKYNGNPDGIKLLVKDNGSPIEGLSRFKNGFLSRYMLNMFTGFTVENEEIPFNFYINDDGTVEIPLNDPGAWDHDYQNPIQWMTRYATENQGGTIYASGNWDDSFRPARRVVLVNNLDEDAIEEPDFHLGDYGEHPPIEIKDGLYYINDDAEDISFTLKAKPGYKLTSVKYRTVNMTIDENGQLSYEEANSYTGTTKLEKGPDGKYKITLDEPHEGDEWSNLGVEITANVTKDAEVTLALASNEGNHAPKDAKFFNWGVRVDSRTYPVEYDEVDQVYKAYVPVDSTVTVSMSSKDDLWTVSEVYPEDASKNNGKKVAASKSGEYTLEVADSATLTARIAQVTRIVVTEATDANVGHPEKEAELEAVKNAYTIKKADKFRAFLASGSHLEVDNLVPNIVTTANFFNGTKPIDAGLISNGVLTAEAENLDLKNDKLALKVTNGTKSYSTTINFTKPTTAIVTSPKETDQGVVVPYGQKAVIQVSVDGNAKNVKAEIRKFVGYDDINKKPITELLCNVTDLGTFDGKTITIYPVKALRHPEGYFPNKYFLLYFFDDQGVEIGESSLYYSAPPIHDKTAPTIKEKADLSSNQSIGLSLALPKQVKAVDGMYYMLEATVCEDAKGNDQTAIVNGAEEHYFANLAYFDDHNDEDPDNDEIVRVYKENVTTFVPASEKTWSLDVSDAPRGKEDGRALSYNVKATMVYASEKNGVLTVLTIDDIEDGEKQKSETSVEQEMSTKDNTYETKLALTKKLPSKIYNTQNDIPVAVPKWSKNASVQGLDRVELINSYGNVIGHWSRWDDNEDANTDNDSFLLNVDEDGLITLDTAWVEIINEGLANEERIDHNLEAGKYTIAAYAIGGPGQEAMATVPVTLLESIHSLYVATPTRILKNYNKAAKVSTELFYNINEREGVPATKAVEWSLAVPDPLNPGEYIDIPEYSPLYGMLTIKNGTVDINKALLVDYAKKIPVPGDSENSRNLGPEDYKFVVGAKAADFEGNTVITYSSPVQITSESQIPTEIQFVWDEFRWDDDAQKEVFFRR
ncbi:MAG: hypothetical protein K6F73_09520, partial [Lachnospiraceae bacterium]|nr:hypothetical protein [Lachnospiraceae bacterium]